MVCLGRNIHLFLAFNYVSIFLFIAPEQELVLTDIESKFVQSRRGIKQGIIEFSVQDIVNKEDPKYLETKRDFSCTFKDNSIRQVVEWTSLKGERLKIQKLMSDEHNLQDDPRVTLKVRDRGDVMWRDSAIFDPRLIGILPGSVDAWSAFEINSFLQRADRTGMDSEKTVDGNYNIRFNLHGTDFQILFDTSKGYEPKVLEWSTSNADVQISESTEIEVAKFGNRWFPKNLLITRLVNGVNVLKQEIIVTKAMFDVELTAGEFELASLNLPKGRRIIVGGKTAVWDGEKISTQSWTQVEEIEPHRRLNWPWIITGLVLIGGALVGVLVFQKRRRS